MRAAIYTRISLDSDGTSDSPERQEAACRQLCDQRGWDVVAVYVDRDISASSGKRRPDLERMWAALEAKQFDVVVIFKLDRLTRRFTDTSPIIERLQRAGADLVSVNDSIDTTTPMGQGVLGLLVSVAEQEAANTSLRVSNKWKSRAAAGKPHIGNRCFGYTKDFEQIPEEVAVAREVVDRILGGETLRSTARLLNDRGITTALGKTWVNSTLRQWLRAPALAGLRSYRPMVMDHAKGRKVRVPLKDAVITQGDWEPIITLEERDQLLVILGSTPPSGKRHEWLLGGLIVCGKCGAPMFGHANVKQNYAEYACQQKDDRSTCASVSVAHLKIEDYVVNWTLDALSTVEMSPADRTSDPELIKKEIAEIERRVSDLDRQRFVENTLSQERWLPASEALASQLDGLRAALDVSLRESDGLRPGNRDDLQKWWDEADFAKRKVALRQAISRVTIQPATVRGARFDTRRVHIALSAKWMATGAAWSERWWASATPEEKAAVEEAGREASREIDRELAQS